MDEIGIGVVTAEILQRSAVAHRSFRETEAVFENFGGVGPGHRVHRVERHRQPVRDRLANGGEVEQAFHQACIIGDRIDDLDGHVPDRGRADRVEIDVVGINCHPAIDRLRAGVNRVGHSFGGRAAIGDIVLDPEIAVGTAGIVARGQDQAAARAIFADDVARRGSGQDSALADQRTAITIGRGDAQGGLDHRAVVEPPVAPDHDGTGIGTLHRVEDRLDEILGITGLREFGHLLPEPGRSGFLAVKGSGRVACDHAVPVFSSWSAATRSAAPSLNRTSCSCGRPCAPGPRAGSHGKI